MQVTNMPVLFIVVFLCSAQGPVQHRVTADFLIYLGHMIVEVTNDYEDESDKTHYGKKRCFCHPF